MLFSEDTAEGILYIVEEFCAGGDLASFLANPSTTVTPVTYARIATEVGCKSADSDAVAATCQAYYRKLFVCTLWCFWGRQLLGGVRYMHDKGIVHRDLKPQNVLLADSGRVKICDLGQVLD